MTKQDKYNYEIIKNDIFQIDYYIKTGNWNGYSEALQERKEKLKVYKAYKAYCDENDVCPYLFYGDIYDWFKKQ